MIIAQQPIRVQKLEWLEDDERVWSLALKNGSHYGLYYCFQKHPAGTLTGMQTCTPYGPFSSPEEAKVAAQDNFEKRVVSALVPVPEEEFPAIKAEHGWVGYNSGPCEWFWSEKIEPLIHELTDDLRPATHLEKYLLNRQGNRTHENDDPSAVPALTNEQRELVLLQIVADMGGKTDSSESQWSWINWFCSDEIYGKQSDTLNRCDEKGWLITSHDTSFDTSTTYLTPAGRAVLEAVAAGRPRPPQTPARSIARAPFPHGVEAALRANRERALDAAVPIAYISGETSKLLERQFSTPSTLHREPSRDCGIAIYDTDSVFKIADALVSLPITLPTPAGCVGEMTAERAVYFLDRFKGEEKLLGPHEQWALDFAIAALKANVSLGDGEASAANPEWDREIIARAVTSENWKAFDTLVSYFERDMPVKKHAETYAQMCSEGVRTGSEARAWLLKDEGLFGWGLRVTLDTADRVIAVMPFTGYGKLTPADLVDKATAWDECDKSYRRARSKALEQAAKLIEDNMLCVPNGVEGIYPRSNPGNRVGLAYAAAIRALDDTKKGSER